MGKQTIFILTFSVFVSFHGFVNCQNLCSFISQKAPSAGDSYIENFSTSKCLRVEALGFLPNAKVVLDDCSYWKVPSRDQQITLTNSTLGKLLLKSHAGNGETFCLTVRNGVLHNSICQPTSFDQNWTFKNLRDNGNQFLIEQYSTKRCLIPKSREKSSLIKLVPCNAFETEQIWKICTTK